MCHLEKWCQDTHQPSFGGLKSYRKRFSVKSKISQWNFCNFSFLSFLGLGVTWHMRASYRTPLKYVTKFDFPTLVSSKRQTVFMVIFIENLSFPRCVFLLRSSLKSHKTRCHMFSVLTLFPPPISLFQFCDYYSHDAEGRKLC